MKKVNLKAGVKKLSLNKVTISKLDAKNIKGGGGLTTVFPSSARCLTLDCSDVGCGNGDTHS